MPPSLQILGGQVLLCLPPRFTPINLSTAERHPDVGSSTHFDPLRKTKHAYEPAVNVFDVYSVYFTYLLTYWRQVSSNNVESRVLRLTVYEIDRHKRHVIVGHALFPLRHHDVSDGSTTSGRIIWRDLERELTEVSLNYHIFVSSRVSLIGLVKAVTSLPRSLGLVVCRSRSL